MNVALLANLKKNAPTWPGMSPDYWDDLDGEETIEAISAALESNGHKVTFLEGNTTLVDTLPKLKPDICFNICESHFGDARESQVPAILDHGTRRPATGVMVFNWGSLRGQLPKVERMGEYYRSIRP